jgi:hypothetical protein
MKDNTIIFICVAIILCIILYNNTSKEQFFNESSSVTQPETTTSTTTATGVEGTTTTATGVEGTTTTATGVEGTTTTATGVEGTTATAEVEGTTTTATGVEGTTATGVEGTTTTATGVEGTTTTATGVEGTTTTAGVPVGITSSMAESSYEINCNDIKDDTKCGRVCKFIYADYLSSDFMNGDLDGVYGDVPDKDVRCFNKYNLVNINPKSYCRMYNNTSCLSKTEEGKCFLDKGVCKSVNLELTGSCKDMCGNDSGKSVNNEDGNCSCSVNCKNNNNCCSDFNDECQDSLAYTTNYDYSNMVMFKQEKYASPF